MRRNGFTMVELIFVIIIIGVLSVAAIPKFGDIKDRAKINAEYSSLSGLDSAIVAKMEFYKDDHPDETYYTIDWHDNIATGGTNLATTTLVTYYGTVNSAKKVLKDVIKKGDDMKIVAYADLDHSASNGDKGVDDLIFIKGGASDKSTGVAKDIDSAGKPDKNDVWVFNGSRDSVTIAYWKGGASVDKVVQSGELALIDIDGDSTISTSYNIDASDGGAATAAERISLKSATTITVDSGKETAHVTGAVAITEVP